MGYIKSLFFNFLVVFFANYLLPGIEIVKHSKLPHIGGDLIFALSVGFLCSMICPLLKVIEKISFGRIVITSAVISFVAYAVIKFAPPFGIEVESVEGYLFASLVVSVGSILINYLEMKSAFHSEMPKL